MEEQKKNNETREESADGVSRLDFIKTVGAGLGAAGVVSLLGGQAFAEGEKKGKYVVVISHGVDDPNRAIFGLLMADVAVSKGWGSVQVWLYVDGAALALKGKAEQIKSPVYAKFASSAAELIKKLKDKGVWFGACPPCLDYFAGGDKFEFVEKAGGDWLMKNIQDAWVVWS